MFFQQYITAQRYDYIYWTPSTTWKSSENTIRCNNIAKTAHQKDKSEITKGNNFADQAAKLAAQQTVDTLMSASTMQIPLDVLKDEQKAAPTTEQRKWLKCGALVEDDLMTCEGNPILPKSLHSISDPWDDPCVIRRDDTDR